METQIIEAARSRGRNVFCHTNTGIISSNPTRDVDDLRFFSVCMLPCDGFSRPVTGKDGDCDDE
jgi:hypothetical protein